MRPLKERGKPITHPVDPFVRACVRERGPEMNRAATPRELVRRAESNGPKPHAWRYRDSVIKSFNAGQPYDRLIREQLAGDELVGAELAQAPQMTPATSPRPMGLDHERLTDFLNGLNHKRTGGVEAQPGRGIIA
jgi:hypothetical protein